MRESQVATVLLIVAFATAAHGAFLTLEPKNQSQSPAAISRLAEVNPSVPGCNATDNQVQLTVSGHVDGLPTATLEVSVRVTLGPTVDAGGRAHNMIQHFSGTLTARTLHDTVEWQMQPLEVGPFRAHTINNEDRVTFVLPTRFDRQRSDGGSTGESLRAASVLAVKCTIRGSALSCDQAAFAFERSYSPLVGIRATSESLFGARFARLVREAGQAALDNRTKALTTIQTSAGGGDWPPLDCCYSSWFCACAVCEGDEGSPQCGQACPYCIHNECAYCAFMECGVCLLP